MPWFLYCKSIRPIFSPADRDSGLRLCGTGMPCISGSQYNPDPPPREAQNPGLPGTAGHRQSDRRRLPAAVRFPGAVSQIHTTRDRDVHMLFDTRPCIHKGIIGKIFRDIQGTGLPGCRRKHATSQRPLLHSLRPTQYLLPAFLSIPCGRTK